MKDLQEPEPPLAEPVRPKCSVGRELQDEPEEEPTRLAREAEERAKQKDATSGKAGASGDTVRDDEKGDEEGGKKDDKNDAEKNDTSAGFTFSMDVVYDKDAKTNDQKDDKKDGKKDDKQDNDKGDEKEPDPHAAKRTAPQDQEHAAQRRATCSKDADAKTTTHPLEQATAVDKESCILKIFHMSLRSYNCLKQFLGFPKHYLILEIFICVNEESQRARA